jgi:hypothetical protein
MKDPEITTNSPHRALTQVHALFTSPCLPFKIQFNIILQSKSWCQKWFHSSIFSY